LIDLKPKIAQALTNDPVLSALLKGGVIFTSLPANPTFPCITYREENNSPGLVGDGEELTSESVMVIDIWAKGDTTAIAQAVDRVMSSIWYRREFAGDLYENDTGVYHKSMRYRHKTTRRY